MNVLRSSTGYSLLALVAMPEDGSYSTVGDLAKRLDLPGPYLSKLLHALVDQGILESSRGRRGGFRMAHPAHRLTIGAIVQALEGLDGSTGCLMGLASCRHKAFPCALHGRLHAVKRHSDDHLMPLTIRDLQVFDFQRQRCLLNSRIG